jgi:hypothetical protein
VLAEEHHLILKGLELSLKLHLFDLDLLEELQVTRNSRGLVGVGEEGSFGEGEALVGWGQVKVELHGLLIHAYQRTYLFFSSHFHIIKTLLNLFTFQLLISDQSFQSGVAF